MFERLTGDVNCDASAAASVASTNYVSSRYQPIGIGRLERQPVYVSRDVSCVTAAAVSARQFELVTYIVSLPS